MYYEEKQIDGVWIWRSTPNGEWHEITVSMLIGRIREMERDIQALRARSYYSNDIGE